MCAKKSRFLFSISMLYRIMNGSDTGLKCPKRFESVVNQDYIESICSMTSQIYIFVSIKVINTFFDPFIYIFICINWSWKKAKIGFLTGQNHFRAYFRPFSWSKYTHKNINWSKSVRNGFWTDLSASQSWIWQNWTWPVERISLRT